MFEVVCFVAAAIFALYAGVYELGYLGEQISNYWRMLGIIILLVVVGLSGWSESRHAPNEEERGDGKGVA